MKYFITQNKRDMKKKIEKFFKFKEIADDLYKILINYLFVKKKAVDFSSYKILNYDLS